MLQELTFKEIALHRKSKRPVIHLQDEANNILPIYVGEDQARSIIEATELRNRLSPQRCDRSSRQSQLSYFC